MMKKTLTHVIDSGSNGIKLSMLHVLRNTRLADEYKKNPFDQMSLNEYADLICELFACLPPDLVVHRFTGDGNKKDLIAPLWSADKKNVLNTINKVLTAN